LSEEIAFGEGLSD